MKMHTLRIATTTMLAVTSGGVGAASAESSIVVSNLRIEQLAGLPGGVVLAQTSGYPFGGVSEARTGFSVFPPTTWSPDQTDRVAGTLAGVSASRWSHDAFTFASIGPTQLSVVAASDPIGISAYAASLTSIACSSCTNVLLGPETTAAISFDLLATSSLSTYAFDAYTWSTTYFEIEGGDEPRQAVYLETCATTSERSYGCGARGSWIQSSHTFLLTNSGLSSTTYQLGFSVAAYAGGLASAVPEPATSLLFCAGALMLGRRLKRSAS